ncbi:MAG: hypothetical protein O7G85_12710 [Planctomycetota bacterium]|nr:hypothetical protein [Planctomycetota bacterium]
MKRYIIGAFALLVTMSCMGVPGCGIVPLIGGMAQNYEYQKLVEVLAEYEGLQDQRVAVLVNADMSTLYEYPLLSRQLSGGLAVRIQQTVPGVRVMNPDAVLAWQFNTAGWNALPYADLVYSLDVDRIVYVELYEYRLNPPGDRWMWEGVCAAEIGIIEREGPDPDFFSVSMNVTTTFPEKNVVTRDEYPQQQIEMGLLGRFIRQTTWLFFDHIEPKYPDKYQGTVPEHLAS